MEQQKDAVEHHLDHVCRVGELLHLLDVSRLDGTDGFVGLLVAARFDGWMDGWVHVKLNETIKRRPPSRTPRR